MMTLRKADPSLAAIDGSASRRTLRLPVLLTDWIELLAITTTARAAGAAAAEQVFFGRNFKLLKFEY